MEIGNRLRAIRQHRQLLQGDIESRTGLLRCYVSRVENGHTVPAVETLEKFARALEVPFYALFYDQAEPARPGTDIGGIRLSRKEGRFFGKLRPLLGKMGQANRQLLLGFVERLAASRSRRKGSR